MRCGLYLLAKSLVNRKLESMVTNLNVGRNSRRRTGVQAVHLIAAGDVGGKAENGWKLASAAAQSSWLAKRPLHDYGDLVPLESYFIRESSSVLWFDS